jgi:hypothetical protein
MHLYSTTLGLLFSSKHGKLLNLYTTARVGTIIFVLVLCLQIILFFVLIISSIWLLYIAGMIGAAIEVMPIEPLITFLTIELLQRCPHFPENLLPFKMLIV